ncbi:MAG: hypothetical protein J6J61_02305 [Muribaculaceae bacterium]|nr:hypothetical protein [Muribaculaceae bacterium]
MQEKSSGMPPESVPSHSTTTTPEREVAVIPVGMPGGVVSPTCVAMV